MPLWRKRLSESEAAALFLRDIVAAVEEAFPSVLEQLRPFVGHASLSELAGDPVRCEMARGELTMAILAAELQALQNLLAPSQGARVRDHVLKHLLSMYDNRGVGERLHHYENLWEDAVAQQRMPWQLAVPELCSAFGINPWTRVGKAELLSPMIDTLFGTVLVTTGGAWWKRTLHAHKLVST